jgi:hypothetical protein
MKRATLHNFSCTLCLYYIYYETDLIDVPLYIIISYPSLMFGELFHVLRVVHALRPTEAI